MFDEDKGKGFLNIKKPVRKKLEIISYIGVKEVEYIQVEMNSRVLLFTPDIGPGHNSQSMKEAINFFEKTIFPHVSISEGSYFCDGKTITKVRDRDEANKLLAESKNNL